MTRCLLLLASAYITVAAYGCGSVDHKLILKDTYAPRAETLFEVGEVTNATGQTYKVGIEHLLTEALSNKLRDEALLTTTDSAHKIIISSNIVEYEEGDAFKRWLLPGWGATVLSVHCELKEGTQLVGSVEARRTVSAGGGYTIGAWRTIFDSLAADVVEDLKGKFSKTSFDK